LFTRLYYSLILLFHVSIEVRLLIQVGKAVKLEVTLFT